MFLLVERSSAVFPLLALSGARHMIHAFGGLCRKSPLKALSRTGFSVARLTRLTTGVVRRHINNNIAQNGAGRFGTLEARATEAGCSDAYQGCSTVARNGCNNNIERRFTVAVSVRARPREPINAIEVNLCLSIPMLIPPPSALFFLNNANFATRVRQ